MKRTLKTIIALSAFTVLGLFSASANAAVNCPTWPLPLNPTATYPQNGHLYNCMPAPQNSAENTFQLDVLARINGATAGDFGSNKLTKLTAKSVDIVVTYDRSTAETKAGLSITAPGTKPTEAGRTFIYPNLNPTLVNPTTLIWVYFPNESVPASPSNLTSGRGNQLSETIKHELGHQMDRVWAQTPNNYSPAATATTVNNSNNTHFIQALQWDIDNMSAADRNTMATNLDLNYFVYGTSPFTTKNLEMYAQEFAYTVKNGLARPIDTWINVHFKCSRQFVIAQNNANGLAPATPPAFCYNHTTWP